MKQKTWHCGHCGSEQEAVRRPAGRCNLCGNIAWEEMLPGEETSGG